MNANFENLTFGLNSPCLGSFPVTPSDADDLPNEIREVSIATGGTIAWVDWHGNQHSTATLPVGRYSMLCRKILATGTTAADITGWV